MTNHPTPPDDAEARRIARTLSKDMRADFSQIAGMEASGEPACTLGAGNNYPAHRALKRRRLIVGERRPFIHTFVPYKRGWPWIWRLTPLGLRVRAILQEADHAGA